MTSYRLECLMTSNNPDDPRKNRCALAVADAFGVADRVRYLHTADDMLRALRKKYAVCSRTSLLARGTVEESRGRIRERGDSGVYVVIVPRHVLVLGKDGRTMLDTAPPDGPDNRKILKIYGVWKQ